MAWSGNSGGWITTTVNLPAAAAGQKTQLKWRCATDMGNLYGGTGWYIDSISLQDGYYACCGLSADLGISVTASTNSVLVGQDFDYTITITNAGPDAAASVTVTDTLPSNVTFVSASPGCVNLGGTVICNAGVLASGSAGNFTISVMAAAAGYVGNRVGIGAATPDPNTANNTAAVVTLANSAPMISTQPTNQVVIAGATAGFEVMAGGTAPLSYQWFFNGTNLAGATTNTLMLNGAQPAQDGNYFVEITNVLGSATSSVAVLTVVFPPAITNPPASQTVLAGANVSFQVAAAGTPPFSYQWEFNGTNLAGATANTLTLTNVQPGQAGGYLVVVTNVLGTAVSEMATLTVLSPPGIISQPANQRVAAGALASFQVTASGTPPFGYQWAFNGTNLFGATTNVLTIANAQPNQAGSYSVVVSNAAASIASAPALLTVLSPPTITAIGVAGTRVSISFTTQPDGNYTLQYKNSLADFNWVSLSSAVPGTGQVISTTDTNGPPTSRFYRVLCE